MRSAKIPRRTSWILLRTPLRSWSIVISTAFPRPLVHCAVAFTKPAPVAAGAVTVNVALTLAPGAIGSCNVTAPPADPGAAARHPAGRARRTVAPGTTASIVFVNVAVTGCANPGVNGVMGDRLTG